MPLLADVVDAVVGVDTHRDVHEAEVAVPSGAVVAQLQVPNSDAGFARLIVWIRASAPGLGWWSRSRAREVTASGWCGR